MILGVALGIVLAVALLYGLWFVLALVCSALGRLGNPRAKHHEYSVEESLQQDADDEEREEIGRREGWTRRR